MKNIIKKLSIGLVAILMLVGIATPTYAYVSVSGYYRSNGTYVKPYVRSNPNGIRYDNYSYKGTGSLYNPSYGSSRYSSSWNTPSWTTDSSYYTGKSLYSSGYSSSYTSPYRSYNYGSLGSVYDTPSSSYGSVYSSRNPVDTVLYGY